MQRHSITLHSNANILGADAYVANHAARLAAAQAFEVGPDGFLSLRCTIDNGSGGPPTDAPVGFWELYAGDGDSYTLVVAAATELAKIHPTGVKLSAVAIFEDVPGRLVKVPYLRSSGGGGNSRVTLVADVNR